MTSVQDASLKTERDMSPTAATGRHEKNWPKIETLRARHVVVDGWNGE